MAENGLVFVFRLLPTYSGFLCVCVWRRKEKRTSILGRQGRDEYNERMMQGNSSHFEASPSPGSQPKWCPLTESFAVLTPFVQRDIRNQIYLVTVSQLLEMTTLVVLAPLPSTRRLIDVRTGFEAVIDWFLHPSALLHAHVRLVQLTRNSSVYATHTQCRLLFFFSLSSTQKSSRLIGILLWSKLCLHRNDVWISPVIAPLSPLINNMPGTGCFHLDEKWMVKVKTRALARPCVTYWFVCGG